MDHPGVLLGESDAGDRAEGTRGRVGLGSSDSGAGEGDGDRDGERDGGNTNQKGLHGHLETESAIERAPGVSAVD